MLLCVYRELIAFTEDDSQEVWKGYLYAILFFAQSIAYSCFYHQLFHIGMTAGMKIKAAVIAMVYRKVRSTLPLFLTRRGERPLLLTRLHGRPQAWARGGRGALAPSLWRCCKVLCALVVTAKRSCSRRIIYALFSQPVVGLWGLCPRPPPGSIPVSHWGTFLPRPLICPPLEKNSAGAHVRLYLLGHICITLVAKKILLDFKSCSRLIFQLHTL